MNVVIIDYGAGNLRSVVNALAAIGCRPNVTSAGNDVLAADSVILPGVGAGGDVMQSLAAKQLVAPIKEYVASGRPFLGICIGMQVLLSHTDEGGGYDCLDIIPGRVRRLPGGQKVPQIGWNQVGFKKDSPLFKGVPDGSNFYFVHSFYADPEDGSVVIGETEYGIPFCSAAARGNLFAVQFHPEKSGDIGLKVYRNFIGIS
jgi:imidazole glycerol-phosphate synthase subunit HisH